VKITYDSADVTRRVHYTITEGEPLASRKWSISSDNGHRFSPTTATVTFADGKLAQVTLAGPRLVKAGPHPYMRGTAVWSGHDIDQAPEWVQGLAAQAWEMAKR
jgi:hypothetical protein